MSSSQSPKYSWPVYLTVLLALVFVLVPFTGWMQDFMPNMVLMVVVYWAIYRPDVLGLGTAWLIGIVNDFLTLSMVGQHALIYVVVVFVLNVDSAKTRNYAFLEYMTWLILFIVFDMLITVLFNRLFQQVEFEAGMLYSVLGGIIIWPWLYVLLNYFENIAAERQH